MSKLEFLQHWPKAANVAEQGRARTVTSYKVVLMTDSELNDIYWRSVVGNVFLKKEMFYKRCIASSHNTMTYI